MTLEFSGTERFQVLSRLGAGGMGVVYAAFDREQRTRVALKTLKEPGAEALLRLKTEFRALQEIRHRNLVSLGELHEAGGHWFFTMEFVDGVDFLRWVRPAAGPRSDRLEDTPSSHGPLSGPIRALPALPEPVEAPGQFDEPRLRAALVDLGRGLGALHAAQCVHRDIKPSNLLVTREGRVVVLDFGLVAHLGEGVDAQTSSPGMAVGTAAYMAPEQAIQNKVGPEADWYAVGVVLYEALTGRLPFAGSAVETIVAKQLGEPTRPRVLCADVPADLDRLCMDLLQVNPRQRPTGPEVLERLRAVGSGPVVVAPPASRAAAFVGRSRELAELMGKVAPLAHGAAATVILHGRSGVGKSELLAQFMRRLGEREPQAVALSGRCYERESVPFKAFDGIVDSLSRLLRRLPREQVFAVVPRNARLLARVFPVLNLSEAMGGVARSHSDVHEPQELRTLAFSALRELIARLSDRFLVVMAIDDLQWADDDSVEILRALTQPPEAPAMLLVATWRTPGELRQEADALRRAQAIFPGGATLVEVAPLPSEDAVALARQLVADLEGRAVAPGEARVEAIASEAEGHPLFIHELVRHTAATRGQEGPERILLDEVLWTRVSALDLPAREVVEAVAVATGPISQRLAGEVLGRPQAELTLILGLLRSAHLVRTSGARPEDLVEPYHDRVREAVLGGMSADARRDWHGRLARAIAAAEHPDPEVLSLHHEAVGDVEVAARYAAQAAQRAASALAFGRAARLYQRAIDRWPAALGDDLHGLRVALAEALASAGRGAEAAEAYLEAVPGAPAGQTLELKQRAAEQLLRSGHVDEGLEATRSVLADLGLRMPRSTHGALLSLLWRRMTLRLRGLRFRERPESEIPAERLVRLDVLRATALTLSAIDNFRGADFSTRFVLAALRAGEPGRAVLALATEANYAASVGAGQSRYGRRVVTETETLLARFPDGVAHAYHEAGLGIHRFMKGEWRAAHERGMSAEGRFSALSGTFYERSLNRFFALWSLFYLGEIDELCRLAPLWAQEARGRGDLFGVSGVQLGLANLAWLDLEGPEAARALVDEIMSSWSVQGYHLQHYWALLARTHIDLSEGRGDHALERLQAEWPRIVAARLLLMPAVYHEGHHLRARALVAAAAARPPEERRPLLRAALKDVRRMERGGLGWTLALGALLRAGVAELSGRPEEAVHRLETAVTRLDEADMGLYAAVARERLAERVGGDRAEILSGLANERYERQRVRRRAAVSAMLGPGLGRPG